MARLVFRSKTAVKTPHLIPLIPKPNDVYGIYVKEIVQAVNNKNVKNIALTGGYGTGKSSIIATLKQKRLWCFNRMVRTISLLSIKENALYRALNTGDAAANKDIENLNSQNINKEIQHEIFKQLFFGVSPNRPWYYPKYIRTGKTAKIYCMFASIIIAHIFVLLRFTIDHFIHFYFPSTDLNWGNWSQISALIYSIIIFPILCRICTFLFTHPIKGITVKELSVDLSDGNPKFEQMADEIIYFFRKSHCKVLILEDIDRFNNILIYESLHQLNNLINSALRWPHRKVTFVYALKDSLISEPGNRTKLFDLIIPVVPFMSPLNITNFIKQTFASMSIDTEELGQIPQIIADNTSDMRTIQAICNTTYIFYRTTYCTRIEGVNMGKIAAIAIIHELYPDEFEKLRRGDIDSSIDRLFIECKIEKDKKVNDARANIELYEKRSQVLHEEGEIIWQEITATPNNCQLKTHNIIIGDAKIANSQQLVNADILNRLAGGETIEAELEYISVPYYGAKKSSKTYTLADFEEKHSNYVKIVKMLNQNGTKLKEHLNRMEDADIFTYAPVLEKSEEPIKKLVYKLIKAGLLDENYQLYLSPFSEELGSVALQNFKLRCVRHKRPDYTARLSVKDIEQLIAENHDFDSPAFYNFDIVNHLLEQQKIDKLNIILASDSTKDDELLNFYIAWCHREQANLVDIFNNKYHGDILKCFNEPKFLLIKLMAGKCPKWSLACVKRTSRTLQTNMKLLLLSSALLYCSRLEELSGLTDDIITEFVDLSAEIIANNIGEQLASVLIENHQKVTNLSLFLRNENAMDTIVSRHAFKITADNLRCLELQAYSVTEILSNYDLSIDDLHVILAEDSPRSARNMVLDNLDKYIDIIENDEKAMSYICQLIDNNSVKLNLPSLTAIAGKIDDDKTLKFLLSSNIKVDAYQKILSRMHNQRYQKLAQLGKRPSFEDNALNKKLLSKLSSRGYITEPIKRNGKIHTTVRKTKLN